MKKMIGIKKDINAKKGDYIKKGFLILKLLISVIFGFLPSFIFIALFVQYGSPFLNYIKFLSNLNASWIAWLSAIILPPIIYFIGKAIKSGKNIKKILKNKFLLLTLILSFLVVLLLISVQLYLYVNFTLGNDILVKLSADKENIFFTDNFNENVTFKISVTMNPFCSAQCEYEFFDIGTGKEIETGAFDIISVLSKYKTYTLNNENLVQGSQVLNRFEVGCKSKRTLLCYTKEDEKKRAVLITLNYELSQEENKSKEDSKEKIILLGKTLYSIEKRLNESKNNINLINDSFSTDSFSQQLKNLSGIFIELNDSFKNLKELWKTQKFLSLKDELSNTDNKTQNLDIESEELNSIIVSNISLYNDLTENLTNSKQILEKISKMILTASLCEELNEVIFNFNKNIQSLKEKLNLSEKVMLVGNISLEVGKIYEKSQNMIDATSSCSLKENINEENLTKINIASFNESNTTISLEESVPICCFFGKCEKCCDDNCSGKNYPVIFLHGHSMNRALPADYSLDDLAKIKEKIVYENYVDAGAIIISPFTEQKGLWGKINTPITVTASYFFDTYKTETGERTVSSKTDSIDTYSIRLKNIIDLVKYRTNKDKVIIISHSMGGLVTRRYVQIFGGKDIDKIILITVPNHGIDDKIKDYCSILGSEVVCNEMNKDSILINKLNNAPTEKIPIYNIIGIGCDMGDETGDGVVKNSSQYLDDATNFYLKGKCNELNFEFFHETILYPEKSPEIYNTISQIIKKKE